MNISNKNMSSLSNQEMLNYLQNIKIEIIDYTKLIEKKLKQLDSIKNIYSNIINIKNYKKILSYCEMKGKCNYCSRDSVYMCIENNKYCWIHAQKN